MKALFKHAAHIFIIFVIANTAGPVFSAVAEQSLRCNGRIIALGADAQEVLDICGEPDHRYEWKEYCDGELYRYFDYRTERYHLPRRIPCPIYMQRWTYNPGSNKFIRYLEFENNELVRIEIGPRGRD